MTHSIMNICTDTSLGGVVEGTCIMTLKGAIAVDFLRAGDRVITRAGAVTLRAVSSRMEQRIDVVHVREGALGHDRPEGRLCLHAEQPVVVRDWRARALYGSDVAIVPAMRLVDGDFIRVETGVTRRVFTLEFDRAEVVIADGVELACAPVAAMA